MVNMENFTECNNCPERKRAEYWHRIATALCAIIGGVFGAIIGSVICSLCKQYNKKQGGEKYGRKETGNDDGFPGG